VSDSTTSSCDERDCLHALSLALSLSLSLSLALYLALSLSLSLYVSLYLARALSLSLSGAVLLQDQVRADGEMIGPEVRVGNRNEGVRPSLPLEVWHVQQARNVDAG